MMKKYIEKTITTRTINPFWARTQRIKGGISLREAARQMGVSAAYVSDMELGKRTVSDKYADFLDLLQSK